MKILFAGDYSGFHATLARELTRRGHIADVVSDGGSYLGTDADFKLVRRPGTAGGFRYLYDLFNLLPRLSGYDVVQLINPHFLSLKPGKLRYFFRRLREQNGSVFLSLAGTDNAYVRACVRDRRFRFSEFHIGTEPTRYAREHRNVVDNWMLPSMEDYTHFIYDHVDGAMSALYEYHVASEPFLGDKLAYTGIPVDTHALSRTAADFSGPVEIMVGVRRESEMLKGTDLLADMARSLAAELPDRCRCNVVSNVPLKEYLGILGRSHIVLDQLYAQSPATNALQAMTSGKIAGSGAQPGFYDFIGEDRLHPVFALDPTDENLYAKLKALVQDPAEMQRRAAEGVEFVKKHNDVAVVADRFLRHWQKMTNNT